MDPKLIGRIGTVLAMVTLSIWILWVWVLCRIGKAAYDKRQWFWAKRRAIGQVVFALVVFSLLYALVQINRQKTTNRVLVNSVRGQTKGMNANFAALDGRVQRIESDRDAKKKADAKKKEEEIAERERMRAVFNEEIAKIRELVEKETGMTWQEILEKSKKRDK